MEKIKMMRVEVAYAQPKKQLIIALEVKVGSTIEVVIQQSGILLAYPDIRWNNLKVGVFSQKRQLSDVVKEGDRIEIYRPLTIDPKEARRANAKKNKRKENKT